MRNTTACIAGGACLVLSAIALSTAPAATRYVDVNSTNPVPPYTDWQTPAATIQDAVNVSEPGDMVLVGPGAYTNGSKITPGAALLNRVVATNAITVQSAYGPAWTAIVGAGPTGDSGARCAYLSGGATLSGFTLTNGHTRASGDALKDCSGGGAYALGGFLANCVISGNTAATNGGGVCRGTVMNCVISGNSADAGGGVFGGTANNCLIAGNTAVQSGGGANAGSLNNCTVCGNTASTGGGTYESGANNSIVYYNSAGTDSNSYAGAFSHSCVGVVPTPGGTGNTNALPQFVHYPDDLHLAYGSPCIDSGDNSSASGDTDLDGNSRIMNGTVDMGAYEFIYVNVSGRVTLDYLGMEGVTVSDGTRSNLTDAGGSYVIGGVPQGSYSLTARKDGYIFHPSSLPIAVTNSDVWGQDFTAERFHMTAAINCGGASYEDANGTVYAADTNFSGGAAVSTANAITNADDELLYQSGRAGASYSIPVTNGDYLLTVKFAEIEHAASGLRIFDVLANDAEILTNLDIFVAAGGQDRAYDVTRAVAVTNDTLDITFNASAGSPLVNAILVVLDETGLVSGPMGTPTWWLRQYELTNDTIDVEELTDTDGDRMPAWEEYIAGTDPTNAASRFCMADVSPSVSGRLQIAISTVPDKLYRLQAATDLVSGLWAGCPYAMAAGGDLQLGVFTAAVASTALYVAPSNAPVYYRARTDGPMAHPRDAVAYGGHFYKVFEAGLSWHEMKTQCEEMNGYLACVESAGEQAFIATLANGRYLALGGTDEEVEGVWKWVNGSLWVHTAWGPGQPNGSLGVESYLSTYDGGLWNDVADRSSDYTGLPFPAYWMPVGYVCEWER